MTNLSGDRLQRQSLKQSWQEYLFRLPEIIGGPYEYVGHFTYRDAEEIPPRHAEDVVRKRFAYFVVEVNKMVYGKRWMRKGMGIWGAMAIEKHLSGYPHHHAIFGGDGLRRGIKRVEMMNIWDEHFGIARVWDYRGEAAAKYLCKYVTKGGVVDVWASAQARTRLKPY
jgi:hypothetical protein